MESVDAALRYLQRQFAVVASDEAQWNEERQKLQQHVRELEDQRGEQEQAYKDAMLRVKMLEFALRQERGRYLASPAAVSSAGGPATKPRSESAEISRGVTVSRSTERSKSARTVEQQPSPAPSPAGSPKAYSLYRTDSRSKSAANTPKNSQGKGTEISRPRMMSRTASGREVERELSRTASGREVAGNDQVDLRFRTRSRARDEQDRVRLRTGSGTYC
ncbi:Striatin [Phytophthora ramorum]|uniref:Striatin n=1 Tax=Phytophthora ramorum TaxID=164328 RepID=UPI0030A708B5|nr:Striatin [Phytophthora ramorum]